MEPIMKLEVVTPEEYMGDIVGDLNRRRGQVNDMSDRNNAKVIKADVPLSEMFGYVTTLTYVEFWSCCFYYGVLALCRNTIEHFREK